MRKAGGEPLEYLRVTMEDVLVTQVAGAGNHNMAMQREDVCLSFARVKQEDVIQNGRGGTVSMSYDIKTNKII